MFKWEDTVMTQYQKDRALKLYLKEHPQYKGLNLWKLVARHQAEITWAIAYKAGIKEVMDSVEEYCSIVKKEDGLIAIPSVWDITEIKIWWQSKLKEWGIDA